MTTPGWRPGTSAGRTERSRVLNSSRQGSVSHQWCEHFYRLLYSSPRHMERWKGEKETFN